MTLSPKLFHHTQKSEPNRAKDMIVISHTKPKSQHGVLTKYLEPVLEK